LRKEGVKMRGTYDVKELTDDLMASVEAFLRNDPLINAYAIWDLRFMRHRSKFFVCTLDGKLEGLLLDYFGHTDAHFIWLWGEENAVKRLLDIPLADKIIFHVFPEFEKIISRKFTITAKYPVDFMLLRKGEERLCQKHEIKPLTLQDAVSFAKLRKEFPSDEEVENAKSFLSDHYFYGIFKNDELTSVASVQVKLPEIWILGGFFTKPEERNKGCATSLASFLVKEAFKETNCVGLYVRADNRPAKRVYEKVGFKVHKRMYWLEHGIDLAP